MTLVSYVECDECHKKMERPYFHICLQTDYEDDGKFKELHFCAELRKGGLYWSSCMTKWWAEKYRAKIKEMEAKE